MSSQSSTARRSAEYVAMTTTNPQYGWSAIARGTDCQQVERDADALLDQSDIYTETKRKNLTIMSVSAARRRFGSHVAGLCGCDRCWTASPFYAE